MSFSSFRSSGRGRVGRTACALLLFACTIAAASTASAQRYPIVLGVGMAAIEFYQVAETLESQGATVFTTTVDPYNNSVARGQQLLDQIEDILAITGASKVNLIVHSQGGLDGRYILATRPDVLASLTTVASPHLGSPVATTTSVMIALFRPLVELLFGDDDLDDIEKSLEQLKPAGAAAYNRVFPAGLPSRYCRSGPSSANGVRLYSWGGTRVLTNVFDLSDALLWTASLSFGFGPNDGLVGRCSNHFGTVLRDNYRLNHFDQLNQFFGLRGFTNPLSVYRSHASRLRNAGL